MPSLLTEADVRTEKLHHETFSDEVFQYSVQSSTYNELRDGNLDANSWLLDPSCPLNHPGTKWRQIK